MVLPKKELETITTEKGKELTSNDVSADRENTPKQRVIETVSLDIIEANICTNKECLERNPHRHQIVSPLFELPVVYINHAFVRLEWL